MHLTDIPNTLRTVAAATLRQMGEGDGMPRRAPLLSGEEERAFLLFAYIALPLLAHAYGEPSEEEDAVTDAKREGKTLSFVTHEVGMRKEAAE